MVQRIQKTTINVLGIGALDGMTFSNSVTHYIWWRCQTKSNQPPKFLTARLLGGQLPPLSQCCGAVLLEDFAAVEVFDLAQ